MKSILIRNARLVNEGQIEKADVYVENGRIAGIDHRIAVSADETIQAEGFHLIPGIIDDQVHFREPGLTHKGDLYTEPRAAVAGGVTSYMEMPNTKPAAFTQALLEEKYQVAAQKSLANYSFFMGTSNDNLEEVLKTDPRTVCGIKIFMGSSTGNLLVDDPHVLDEVFRNVRMLIATHCEHEPTIRANEALFRERYGENVPIHLHPVLRDAECCLRSSKFAVELAQKHGTRLHILHISTADELALFRNDIPLREKLITAEVCVHHLWFSADDYAEMGSKIKCNPAIKSPEHRAALLPALLDDRLDIIATDHAPHTLDEKSGTYFNAPSGVPLVQHSLNMMLEFFHREQISLEKIVEKMCHAPAELFRIEKRGFLREGYWADLALVDLNERWSPDPGNTYYKCGWSPFFGKSFRGRVTDTLVSGHWAFHRGKFDESKKGERLLFDVDGR
jgi:dihydroorotase